VTAGSVAVGVACAVPAAVAAALGVTRRGRPGATAFAVTAATLAVVGVVVGLGRAGVVPLVVAGRTTLLGWQVATVAWAVFAVRYTGRGPAVTRARAALLAGLAVAGVGTVQATAVAGGTALAVAVVVASMVQLLTVGVGAFGVFAVSRATSYGDLDPPTAATLAVGGVAATLTLLPAAFSQVLSTAATLGLALVPVTVGGGALALAAGRLGLFADSPSVAHLARERVLEELPVAVLVVDRDGRVLDANRRAVATFGTDGDLLGAPVRAVVGADPATLVDDRATLSTSRGRREFVVTRSTLSGREGDPVGETYRFEDVTDRRTDRQRLAVLERVLRHNLRNDLDALGAFGRRLAETDGEGQTPDSGSRRLAARVEGVATTLVELGETAGRVERLLSTAPGDDRVDLVDLARSVADDATVDRPGTATVSAPTGEVCVRTDRDRLRAALAELVANALDHADGDAPVASVRVRSTDDGATVAVRDEGPGIPEREQAVLLAGDERPLRHGSGLGLWLVYWCVTTLGGRVEFDAADGGSVVTVRVPDRPTGSSGDE
jgi:signal transduction histidine kinase